jgi:phosphatidylserine/phosphatidylglycerophosphate/cardiolipin synthase-like enzyme
VGVLLARRYYRRLLTNGVRLWEWQGEMMHAKTRRHHDGRWVRVGSTDFNPLGVAINYELDAVIEDPRWRKPGDVPRRPETSKEVGRANKG